MALDDLINRILENARLQAEEIKKKANLKAKDILKQAEKEAARVEEEIIARAKKKGRMEEEKTVALATLEARNHLVKTKQKLIEKAFNLALDQIINLNDQEYLRFIEKKLLESVPVGDEVVIIAPQDRSRITSDFINQINEKLKKRKKKGQLRISPETRQMKGGFILKSKRMEINYSLESLIQSAREKLELEVAEMLFGKTGGKGSN